MPERLTRFNVPEGEITVRVEFSDGQRFRIGIRDSGPVFVTEARRSAVYQLPPGDEPKVFLRYLD
jgi:hypothetical protein